MFKAFYEKYLCLNLKDYFGDGFDLEINKLLIFIFLGLCIASVVINVSQATVALMLKKLLRLEAFGEEKAKTLKELRLADNKMLRYMLKSRGGQLKRLLRAAGEKVVTYEEYIAAEEAKKLAKRAKKTAKREEKALLDSKNGNSDEITVASDEAEDTRYYIPEESRDYATHYLERNNSSGINAALSCVTLLAVLVGLIFLMPSLLEGIKIIFG